MSLEQRLDDRMNKAVYKSTQSMYIFIVYAHHRSMHCVSVYCLLTYSCNVCTMHCCLLIWPIHRYTSLFQHQCNFHRSTVCTGALVTCCIKSSYLLTSPKKLEPDSFPLNPSRSIQFTVTRLSMLSNVINEIPASLDTNDDIAYSFTLWLYRVMKGDQRSDTYIFASYLTVIVTWFILLIIILLLMLIL